MLYQDQVPLLLDLLLLCARVKFLVDSAALLIPLNMVSSF